MKVGAALGRWTEYRGRLVELNLVAESTWKNQTTIAGVWAAAMGLFDLARIRKSTVEIAMGQLLQHRSPLTVQGDMNVLRQFLNWCLDEQLIDSKPRLPIVKVETVELPLPSDEAFTWALAVVPPHHARALEFMMLMGLSPHELERLRPGDAGVRPGSYVVVDQHRRPIEEPAIGIQIGGRADFKVKQSHRRRWIVMEGRALAIWKAAAAANGRPFPSVGTMDKMLGRRRIAAAAAGDEIPEGAADVTPKMMRKWFASKMSSPGEDGRAPVPEHVLQRLLGHVPGSKITRRHYVRSSADQCDEAMGRMCPL